MSNFIPSGLGWQRDLPDPRDYTPAHEDVVSLLDKLPPLEWPLPSNVDLCQDDAGLYLPTADDQGYLNSSPAFACLALVEYFHRKALGLTFEGSPRFLYEMTRRLTRVAGDAGVGLRATLKTLRRFGAPPEELRPYTCAPVETNPPDLSLLGFCRDLEWVVYFRLDSADQSGVQRLAQLKMFLAAGFPVALGFSVPRSLTRDGVIPYRPRFESYRGGQAVLVVGYDDEQLVGRQGALRIRNSWGPDWGQAGYGWLPYTFVTHHLAADLWTAFDKKWAESKEFFLPRPPAVCGGIP